MVYHFLSIATKKNLSVLSVFIYIGTTSRSIFGSTLWPLGQQLISQ
jgi:hypothetical protein